MGSEKSKHDEGGSRRDGNAGGRATLDPKEGSNVGHGMGFSLPGPPARVGRRKAKVGVEK